MGKKDLRLSKNWPFRTSFIGNEKAIDKALIKMRLKRPDARFRKQKSEGGMLFRIVGLKKR
jgi:hypothetical protein